MCIQRQKAEEQDIQFKVKYKNIETDKKKYQDPHHLFSDGKFSPMICTDEQRVQ
jgi:hypothetical protein